MLVLPTGTRAGREQPLRRRRRGLGGRCRRGRAGRRGRHPGDVDVVLDREAARRRAARRRGIAGAARRSRPASSRLDPHRLAGHDAAPRAGHRAHRSRSAAKACRRRAVNAAISVACPAFEQALGRRRWPAGSPGPRVPAAIVGRAAAASSSAATGTKRSRSNRPQQPRRLARRRAVVAARPARCGRPAGSRPGPPCRRRTGRRRRCRPRSAASRCAAGSYFVVTSRCRGSSGTATGAPR